MSIKEKIVDSSFYGIKSNGFRNSLYALNIGIESKFTSEYFNNETGRIVYSLNSFALRKRAMYQEQNTVGNLNFPFMNYKIKKVTPSTKRPWFNTLANVEGIFVDEISRKLRLQPITVDYEATFFTQRDDDMQYIFQKLSYDNSVETLIKYIIEIDAREIEVNSVIDYNLQYEPTYDENEWLKKNNVHSIAMDFSVQTMYVLDEEVLLPRSIVLDFIRINELGDQVGEELTQFVVDRYSEENTQI